MTPHDIAWYEAELDKRDEEIQRLTDILDAIRLDCEQQTRIHSNPVPFSYTDGPREMQVRPMRPRLTLVRRTESFIHDDPSEYKEIEVVESGAVRAGDSLGAYV